MPRTRLLTSLALTAAGLGLSAALIPTASADTPERPHAPKPTVVLVHGAWADASGWSNVVKRLQKDGYPVVAPPNPLRSLSTDSAYLAAYLKTISGPIVLVGHSYGGAVITNAATDNPNVKALVYIAAFAPDRDETVAALSAKFPGSHLTDDPTAPIPTALNAVPFPQADGTSGVDFYLKPDKFRDVFLSGRGTSADAAALAATQRPIAAQAFGEPTGAPAWRTIPSWYLVAKNDHAIAPAAERFMAHRAHAHTVETDAPHDAQLTDPRAVSHLIERAARSTGR
ncbi:alpha/beta hydrolase [Streptomyces sp. NPDC005209]|uniref:alpha/beta fold hydrolase n=1 Tax=Streptomyces sp. NPDC005209 TaxID=3156715 RepID=UPI0033B8DB8E